MRIFLAACTLLAFGAAGAPAAAPQAPARAAAASGLKIIVIAGEDGVNIVQTRTAVAPVVEVRDRNDTPVAGAVVRFAIQSGRASFANSARTLAVATDFSGRAAATALTPTGTGAVQIGVTASFEGQTVAATISQVNVATAAQAAAGSGAAGTSGAGGAAATGTAPAGAGAAAGGATVGGAAAAAAATGGTAAGGISATALAVMGAAAGGGALALHMVAGQSNDGPQYVGTFAGQIVITFSSLPPNQPSPCTVVLARSGTLRLSIAVQASGEVSGTAEATLQSTQTAATTCSNAQFGSETIEMAPVAVSGTAGAMSFSGGESGAVTAPVVSTYSDQWVFAGALAGDVITATLTNTYFEEGASGNAIRRGTGSVVLPITLSRQ